MKRTLNMILILCLLTVLIPAQVNAATIVDSGTCGDNLTWTITDDYTITISGTGDMSDYNYSSIQDATDTPWTHYTLYFTKIVIEDGVTSIGESAFRGCSNVTEIYLGNDIKEVGGYAFFKCDKLLNVYIGDLETWCSIQFESATANPAYEKYINQDGTYVFYDTTLYLNGMPLGSELVIPNNITDIGDYTFYSFNLTDVTFHDGITRIGNGAFCGTLISSIEIPNSVTTIGDYAFSGMPITAVEIPDSVTNLGNDCFNGCSNLTEVILSENLTSIGERVFYYCEKLNNLIVPDGVTSLGHYAFGYCSQLNSISLPDSLTSIGSAVFSSCPSLEEIVLPQHLQTIGRAAFSYCTGLTEITIPDSVISIDEYAFRSCTNLKKVTLSEGLKSIGAYAFADLTGLTDISLPDSVEEIGDYAFSGCSGWTNPSVPSGVKTVGEYAYSGCVGLKTISIPASTTDIGKYAFWNCSNANSVAIAEGLETIKAYVFSGCSEFKEITIPASVSVIESYAFSGCTNLNKVVFLGDAPSIGDYGFADITATCWYPAGNSTYSAAITTAEFGGELIWTYEGETIPGDFNQCGENVTWELREDGAMVLSGTGPMYNYSVNNFEYAPWYEDRNVIKSIEIAEGITTIGDGAFYGCSNCVSVSIPSTVTYIGDCTFQNCSITSAVLPEDLTEIGEYAFKSTKITSIEIPEGVIAVGAGAFSYTSLTKAVLPDSLTYIPDSMFSFCYNLLTVDFQDTLVSIGNNAFNTCVGLSSVVLPEGLVSIGDYAFEACGAYDVYQWSFDSNNFTSVTLPSTLRNIGKGAFWYCQSLKTLIIPNGVSVIEANTFGQCRRLVNVKLPVNLTKIGTDAFLQCIRLTSVTFMWGAPQIADDAFSSDVKATCYYPSNNEAWTEDMLKNYGGTLTWTAQEMEVPLEGPGGGSGDNAGEDEGDDSDQAGGAGSGNGSGESQGGDSENTGTGGSTGGNTGNENESSGGTTDNDTEGGGTSGESGGDGGGGSPGGTHTHSFDNGVESLAPTCVTDGTMTYTCTTCGYSEDDLIYATGHSMVDGMCSVCGCIADTITQKGRNLSYEDMIYVIDIFELTGVDGIDLTTDAGILVWSVEEYEALSEIAYDEAHANPGLESYPEKPEFYFGKSDGIFTRDLYKEAYYVGYVKLPDGTYIYSEAKLYSPATYAYTMLGKTSTTEKTKTLCVALLNYISAAQRYFDPSTPDADLVNVDLTEEQKALTWNVTDLNLAATEIPADKDVARDKTVFAGRGKNLLFEEMISLVSVYVIDTATIEAATECGTIFWTAEQFEALTEAPSVDNFGEGTKVTGFNVYQSTDGQWYSAAPAVAPKDMAETEYYILGYVIHADGSVSYSGVMSYTFEQYISNMATNAKMGEFAQRLYYYERAAQATLG